MSKTLDGSTETSPNASPVVPYEGNAVVGISAGFGVLLLSLVCGYCWRLFLPQILTWGNSKGIGGMALLLGMRLLFLLLIYMPPVIALLLIRHRKPRAFDAYCRTASLLYGLITPIVVFYLA